MSEFRLDRRRAVESIVRLRRAERVCGEAARLEVETVLAFLEDIAGATVSRADAARLLGISHTALDRWIDKGDVPAVLTPGGRLEVPLPQLVDLLEQIEERRDEGRLALASVIRDRRREAEAITDDTFLPQKRTRPRTHRTPELQALAYHRLVAQRLDARLVRDARKRLERWRQTGRIDPRWADEWDHILGMPIPKIARLLSSNSTRSRELRQTSPFAGSLNEQERRRVLRAVEERASQ
jgi:hypothetical protein